MSFEEGATLGVGSVAAAETLFHGLQVTSPFGERNRYDQITYRPRNINENPWILIWGGSCVTGIMATQLAKQSGYQVLAVASLQNARYLETVGADKVIDRHQPQDAIDEAQRLQIRLGMDCVGQQTATWALSALQPTGRLACLVKGPDKTAVAASRVEVTDILIKRFHEDAEYGQSLMDYISDSLASRLLRSVRYEQIPEGFEALNKGLERLKSEAVSGKKLVVTVSESTD